MNQTAFPNSTLSAQRLREVIREARGGFAPDYVARTLREREHEIAESDAGEVAQLLRELVALADHRLREAGIEPQPHRSDRVERLTKREREYVANVVALLSHLALSERQERHTERALAAAYEGMAWCRTVDDSPGMVRVLLVVASVHAAAGSYAEEEEALREGVECARGSSDPHATVGALNGLAAFLVVRMRLDEAEAAVEEALALARQQQSEPRSYDYPSLLLNRARVQLYRTHYADGIRTLQEALRWADPDVDPRGRAALLTHLGSVYLRLEQFQQCIECQHEVVRLGEQLGSNEVQGWGYYRLAEAQVRLREMGVMEEMLDRAEVCAGERYLQLRLCVMAKRAQLRAWQKRFDEGVALCHRVVEEIDQQELPDLRMFAYKTLAEIAERRERYEEAVENYERSLEVSDTHFPARSAALRVSLAEALYSLDRDSEVAAVLNAIAGSTSLNDSERFRALHLQAAMAEKGGDLRAALDLERESFTVERGLLERSAADSLRNTRIVAETSLLEREADFERERRHRVERELAEAVVELGERRRLNEEMEGRMRALLARTETDQERQMVRGLREMLYDLRTQASPAESPLRYLSGVDQDFYSRLRRAWPDLTSKQERLCGLIRAGLGSKEIATLLDLGQEGLKAQRKRLRKRMNLRPEEKLETVLAEI